MLGGNRPDFILVDFRKAFNTVDDDIFLQKLYAIGFPKHAVNWFKFYLSNRSFLVNLENNFPQPASVSCDVPQWSILRQLVFLIHVNGILQAVTRDFFSLY